MQLEEVRALSTRELLDLGQPHPWLGRYYIRASDSDLWFRFGEAGLEAITWSRAEAASSDRFSPQRNLCDGALSFWVNVSWPSAYEGSDVYLDDQLIGENSRVCPQMIVSLGEHELRVVKEGYLPVVRRLQFGEEDRGNQDLHLTEDLLRSE